MAFNLDNASRLVDETRQWTKNSICQSRCLASSGISITSRQYRHVQLDITGLKTDVAVMKTDILGMKTDMTVVKTDITAMKTDTLGMKNGHDKSKEWCWGYGCEYWRISPETFEPWTLSKSLSMWIYWAKWQSWNSFIEARTIRKADIQLWLYNTPKEPLQELLSVDTRVWLYSWFPPETSLPFFYHD